MELMLNLIEVIKARMICLQRQKYPLSFLMNLKIDPKLLHHHFQDLNYYFIRKQIQMEVCFKVLSFQIKIAKLH